MNQGWMAARGMEPRTEASEFIQRFIPQRPPFLLVKRLLGFRGGPHPAAVASLRITGEETILVGHFPGRPVWPGSYTIEGLAQTCALAGALAQDRAMPSLDDRREAKLILVAAVSIKLTGIIAPPAQIDYFAEVSTVVGDMSRFAVEAWIGAREVARGSIDVVVRDEVLQSR